MRWLGALLLLPLAAGCAGWRGHGVDLMEENRLRLFLPPVRCSVKVADSARISGEVQRNLEAELRKYPWFELVASSAQAQAVLDVDVGGYGKLKRKWVLWLIGSGVVEGAVQGALVAQVGGPWAAAGVAAEEVVQEGLTWGGGVWLFNRVFTPVILDGKLTGLADRRTLWSETAWARINRKALKRLPEAERKVRAVRLRLTAEKAAEELIEDLAQAARRNVHRQMGWP